MCNDLWPRQRLCNYWSCICLSVFIKQEVHNVSQRRQRRTEPRPQEICTQNFTKIGPAVPEICSRTDRQTDRQTNRNTLLPYWGGATNRIHGVWVQCTQLRLYSLQYTLYKAKVPLCNAINCVVCLLKLSTTFWSGDAFNVCHSRLPSDVTFDVISTSNLIDHVGLLNLLVTCQTRLKKYDTLLSNKIINFILISSEKKFCLRWRCGEFPLKPHISAHRPANVLVLMS